MLYTEVRYVHTIRIPQREIEAPKTEPSNHRVDMYV